MVSLVFMPTFNKIRNMAQLWLVVRIFNLEMRPCYTVLHGTRVAFMDISLDLKPRVPRMSDYGTMLKPLTLSLA